MPERIKITGLTYGAHGVGRLDGKVIFTRNVVRGEEVEVQIQEDHGSYAYAALQRIVSSVPERRTPPCPYLPQCGGCPWQHISYAEQLRAKQQNLRDQLERHARLKDVSILPIIPSAEEFGYRSRLTMRTAERRVGFYAAASHDLVAVEKCLLSEPALHAGVASAAALVRSVESNVRRIEAVRSADDTGVVLVAEIEGRLSAADQQGMEPWLRLHTDVRGVVLHGKGWRSSWGDTEISIQPLPGESLRAQAGSFTQVNPAANQKLVETVLGFANLAATHHVIDVYAGIGNFTIPLARHAAAVIAIEQNAAAAADAARNAQRAGLSNVQVMHAPAHRALRQLAAQRHSTDLVVLDPPRSGAADVVQHLRELKPQKIIYVSCNPATLARDLRALSMEYRITAVQPLDLFPQTYHVEAVAEAVLTC